MFMTEVIRWRKIGKFLGDHSIWLILFICLWIESDIENEVAYYAVKSYLLETGRWFSCPIRMTVNES